MRKLNLRVDDLSVDSFAAGEIADVARGTVHADGVTLHTAQCGTCAGATCGGATCFTSCSPGGNPACTCPPAG
jgi:hypothetical protein